MKKKLSIVIISKNRHSYLEKQIEYWNKKKNINLIIIDGSTKKLKNKKKKFYLYFHKRKSFSNRMIFASSLVKTKYVCFLADDDFFLYESLIKNLQFLEKNNKFVACRSEMARMIKYKKNIYLSLKENNYSPHLLKKSFEKTSLIKYFTNYFPQFFYSICRTKIWKKALKNLTNLNEFEGVYAIEELLFELGMSSLGSIKHNNNLYHVRNSDNQSLTKRLITFEIWWQEKKNQILLCNHLKKFSINSTFSVQFTKNLLDKYSEIEIKKNDFPKKKAIFISTVLNFFPKIISNYLIKIKKEISYLISFKKNNFFLLSECNYFLKKKIHKLNKKNINELYKFFN